MMESLFDWLQELRWIGYVAFAAFLLVAPLVLALRVIMRRLSVGETLAWLLILFLIPGLGMVFYLTIGELRLGRRRVERFLELSSPIREWLEILPERHSMKWESINTDCQALSLTAERGLGIPTLPGNQLKLIDNWQAVFEHLIADIDAAEHTCHFEFYIWHPAGDTEPIAEALIRASQRGVRCRVLVDALGSRKFLRSATSERLQASGVQIQAALPGGLLRLPFVRFDIRMHRKIVVIDGKVAYTGSLNLVDPRHFKRDSGVGQWIDAMVRLEGPAVEALAITFLADWFVETDATLEELRGEATPQPQHGEAAVQVLPSGPAYRSESIEQVLLMAVYMARHELVLTTPYFVPSESLLTALELAAHRGVKVILIVPKKVDSLLVRFASQAGKGDLLRAGVRIANFQDGLLHTKSVTIDGQISLFGTLNLDPRSFRLNFEISLAIYDRPFAEQLRALQQSYLDRSELMNLQLWEQRSMGQRVAENIARMFGPLL